MSDRLRRAFTLDAIRERAPLLAPLALVAVINLATALAMRPAFHHAFARQPEQLARAVEVTVWLVAVAYPIVALAKAVVLAAMAWAVAALAGAFARLRTLVSLLLYGELVLLGSAVFTAVVVHVRGLDTLRAPGDLLVSQGVDMFVDLRSPVGMAILQHTSVFYVAWFLFLCVALPGVTGVSRAVAIVTALALWASLLLFGVVRASFAA